MKLTIRVDAEVVRFFKYMGPGYQPRMNKVQRCFMHARLAKMINGPECAWEVQVPRDTVDEVSGLFKREIRGEWRRFAQSDGLARGVWRAGETTSPFI